MWLKWFSSRGGWAQASVSPSSTGATCGGLGIWPPGWSQEVFACQETLDLLERIQLLTRCTGGAGGSVWATRVNASLPYDPDQMRRPTPFLSASLSDSIFYWLCFIQLLCFCGQLKGPPSCLGKEPSKTESNWTWNQKQSKDSNRTVRYCLTYHIYSWCLCCFFFFFFRSRFFISSPFRLQAILYFHPVSFSLIAELLVLQPGITSFPSFWPQMLEMIPLPACW